MIVQLHRLTDLQHYLEVELEPVVVRAAVQVGGGVAALVQPGPALRVAEQEGALEGALDGLGVPPEHGVHGRVPCDVVTQRLERVEVCLTVTCTQQIINPCVTYNL